MGQLVSTGQLTINDYNDGMTVYLSNEGMSLPADSDGVVTSYTGASTTMYIFLGQVDDSAAWSVAATPSTGVAGAFGSGPALRTYTITSLTVESAYVDFVATKQGFQSVRRRFSLSKARRGMPGNDGADGVDGTPGSDGTPGAEGISAKKAYAASFTATTTTAPASTLGPSSVPSQNQGGIVGTWSLTVPTIVSGQYMWIVDGSYSPVTNQITWSVPYWASLRVGELSAITVDTGNLNISGGISTSNGNFSVDSSGLATFKSLNIVGAGNNTILSPADSTIKIGGLPNAVKNIEAQFTPIKTWEFRTTTDGWSASGAGLTLKEDSIVVTSSGGDPVFSISGIAINGAIYDKVRMRVKRVAGTGWEGACYYGTLGHGFSASYKSVVTDTTTSAYTIVEWDFSQVADWTTNAINSLRFDLGALASDAFEIDWICVGKLGPATTKTTTNLVDTSWWVRNAPIQWLTNYEENQIVVTGTDCAAGGPKGPDEAVWHCKEVTGDSEAGGGWEGVYVTVDPTKTYRFVVPIKRLSGYGTSYWGIDNVAQINTTTLAPNPYFATGNLTTGKWYLFVGYIYPAGSSGNVLNSGGVWDCSTGIKVASGSSFNHLPGRTVITHRAYQYYAGQDSVQILGAPTVNVVDGTEPSLREYFSASAVLNSSQQWAEVTGVGRPQDYATDGADISNLKVGIGSRNMFENSLPNSLTGFTTNGNSGNSIENDGVIYVAPASASSIYSPGRKGCVYVHVLGSPANGTVQDLHKNDTSRLQVFPSTRYEFGVDLSAHRCECRVIASWFTSANVYISQDVGNVISGTGHVHTDGPFPRSVLIATSPANAGLCVLTVRMFFTGLADPYVFASQWYMGTANPTQNTASPWSESPSVISNLVATAQAAASAAQASANSGAAAAAEALLKITNIGSDLILSPGEKPEVLQKWNVITGELQGIYDRGTEYGLTTLRNAYDAAYYVLANYLNTIPGWNVIPGSDVVITSAFRTGFEGYYLARQTLLNAIATEAGKRAVWATGISGRPQDHELLNSAIAKGAFVNRDPNFEHADMWEVLANGTGSSNAGFAYVTNEVGAGSKFSLFPQNLLNSSDVSLWALENKMYPIDPSRVYDMSVKISTDLGNGRTFYAGVCFYTSEGTYIENSGWGGTWSGYPITGVPTTTAFARYSGLFGAGTAKLIPSNATQCRVGIILNYGTGGVGKRMVAQELKLVDATEVRAAHDAAVSAQATADSATAQAAAANLALGNIASDNVLSMSEKSELILKVAAMDGEFNDIIAKADAVSVNRDAYFQTKVVLNAYLAAMSPAWNDTTTNTTIVGTTFRANFADYYTKRQLLLNAIAAKAATTANWSTGLVNRPTDAQLLNNRDNVIENPGGGIRMQQGANEYGAIKIMLPVGWSDTMLKFTVDIYEYRAGYSCQVEISGYTYNPTASWINVSARMSSSSGVVEYPVYFGYDSAAGKCAVWIGSAADDWAYPQIRIKDVFLGYNAVTKEMWESGWNISIGTAAPTNVSATILDTLPGSDWSKTKGADAVTASITAAQTTATNAANAAAAAQADADAAETALNGIVSDNILSRTEKSELIAKWNMADAEEQLLISQASSLGVSFSSYTSTKSALANYLVSLSPYWSDLTQDTPIIGTTFRTYWTDYNSAKVSLLNAIAAKTATMATWAGTTGVGKPDDYATYGANKDNLNVTLPGDNLCLNSSFERAGATPGLAEAFAIYNNGGGTEPTTASFGTGRQGGQSQIISWENSHQSTKGVWGSVCSNGWQEYKTYVISFYACTSSMETGGYPFISWNIAPATTTQLLTPSITPSWQRYAFRVTMGATVEPNGRCFFSAPLGSGPGNIWFDDFMVTEGDVLAAWYPSTLDAQAVADAAKVTAANAQSAAEIANAAIANIASDNILSPVEKPALVQAWNVIVGELQSFYDQGTSYGLTALRDAYNSAYTALYGYLAPISGWDTIPGSDVVIVGSTLRSKFADYYVAKQSLLNGIVDSAKTRAAAAQSTANTALSNAATAQAAANTANNALANIASDNILSPVEKPAVVQAWTVIQAELQSIYDRGTAMGISALRNAYDAAYYEVAYYLESIPGWNTIPGSDVTIVGSTLRSKFAGYYSARQSLLNEIAAVAATKATWAGTTGTGKPEDYATVGADATNLKVGVGNANQLSNSLPNSLSGLTHGGNTGVALESGGLVYEFGGIYSSDRRGTVYAHWVGTPVSGAYHDIYLNNLSKMRVTAGQRYEFGVDLSIHRCQSNIVVAWYNNVDSYISENEATQLPGSGAIYDYTPFPRSTLFATAPAGAYFAMVFIRTRFFGQADPYVFLSKSYAGVALVNQTTASPWSDSPGALSANIAAAQAVIDNISSDNVITKGEKPEFILKWTTIANEVNDILTKADTLTVSRVDYLASYTTLNNSIPSGWNDLTTDTPIVGATIRANFLAYYSARQLLLNAMDVKASTLSTWVGTTGVGRPSDNATADIQLIGRDCTITGNTITRSSGADGSWAGDAYSPDAYTNGAFASFKVGQSIGESMLGLNSDPVTDKSYTSLDFAIYVFNGGFQVYESTINVAGTLGTYSVGDTFAIHYFGSRVEYSKNGVIFLTRPATPGLRLYFDCSIAYLGHKFTDVRFGPLSPNDWASIGGPNRPSDNATSNLRLVGNGCLVEGNKITKTAANSLWNGEATTAYGYTGGAHCSATITSSSGQAMFGLNDDPFSSTSYESLSFAVYLVNLQYYVYESNVSIGNHGNCSVGDEFTVAYDGVNVRYSLNGTVFRTVAAAAGLKLHFDSSIYTTGYVFSNIAFGPLTNNDFSAIGGSTKPANNATVGAVAGTNLVDSNGQALTDAGIKNGYTEGNIGHVVRPSGGSLGGYGSNAQGALAIILPQARYASSTMLRIRVEIYEYATNMSCTYILSGYNDSSQLWYNVSASYDGPPAGRKQVRFGRVGSPNREVIYIGDVGTYWQYPQVRITEVTTGYTTFDSSLWSSGWVLSLAGAIGSIEHTVATPGVGGEMARIDQLTPSNVSTYIAPNTVGNAQFGGDLYSSNWLGTTGVGGAGWYLERTGNFYGYNVKVRGAIMGGNYNAYQWPEAGTYGFYLGSEGLLLGNINNGTYFQVTNTGNIYSPQFNIVNGSAVFSGALSAASGTFAGSLSAATGSFAGSLSAATGSFGSVTVAEGGSISSGQTAYNTGIGWHLSLVGGVPKFSLGNPNGHRLTFDGTNLAYVGPIELPPFSVSISGTLDTTKSNTYSSVSVGTLTATATGGRGTLTYQWSAFTEGTDPDGATGLLSVTVSDGTITGASAKVSAYNTSVQGRYQVMVTDADNRVAIATRQANVQFGTPQ